VEKTIEEDQSRVNLQSLAAGAEAASHPKKQPAAPGTTGGAPGGDGPAKTNTTDPKPEKKKGKGDKGKGKGKDQDGKGKGGKDQGKEATGQSSGGNSPKVAPDPNRSCITNLFGKCKHGAVLGKGVTCERGIHRKKPLDSDRTHPFFKKMEKEHGTWEPNKFKYPDGSVATPAVGQGTKSGVGTNGNAGSTPPASPTMGAAKK